MHLKTLGREGVALSDLALGKAGLEPTHALRRGAVGERVRHDTALALLLQTVIANRVGRIQRFFDIAGFQPVQAFTRLAHTPAKQSACSS